MTSVKTQDFHGDVIHQEKNLENKNIQMKKINEVTLSF